MDGAAGGTGRGTRELSAAEAASLKQTEKVGNRNTRELRAQDQAAFAAKKDTEAAVVSGPAKGSLLERLEAAEAASEHRRDTIGSAVARAQGRQERDGERTARFLEDPFSDRGEAPAADSSMGLQEDETEGEWFSGVRQEMPEPEPEPLPPVMPGKTGGRRRGVRLPGLRRVRLIVLIVILAALVFGGLLMTPLFSVKHVEVEGNSYYSDEEVSNIANISKGGNLFRSVSFSQIRERLLADPYFTDVSVHHRLPSTILLRVTERKQLAACVYGGEYVVIDGEGTVLRKSDIDPRLTLIRGLTITKMEPGTKLGAEESGALAAILNILESMDQGDFYFTGIRISGSQVTAHITDTLLVKGEYGRLKECVDDGSLQKVVNRLFKENITHGTITIGSGDFVSFSPEI